MREKTVKVKVKPPIKGSDILDISLFGNLKEGSKLEIEGTSTKVEKVLEEAVTT